MDDLRALTTLNNLFMDCDDDELKAALVVLVHELMAFPPTPLGCATHEARQLARQFAKTGLLGECATPPGHSQAVERLVHRLTCLLEAMLNLLVEANTMEIGS